MKKLTAFLLAAVLFTASFTTAAKADDSGRLEEAYQSIQEQIIADYGSLYALDHFSYDYLEREEGNMLYVDMNIYADMTLTRDPAESPYVKGLRQALLEETSVLKKLSIQAEIDAYLENAAEYYQVPGFSTFTYTIAFPKNAAVKKAGADAYQVFYRSEGLEEALLIDADQLAEVENEAEVMQSGYLAGKEASEIMPFGITRAAFTYNRIAARDWAYANVFSAPEYPSASVPGTDCANFVSKALNAGGIPEDRTGKWYRAGTWGGWPGDNWFRTGFSNNGGVVPYMTGKGYFYKEPVTSRIFAGSIMYWNTKSHVALVTSGDGVTIKYTEHGAQQTKDTVYRTENASFYLPSASIMP